MNTPNNETPVYQGPQSGARVLIVDDEEVILTLLMTVLADQFQVATCMSGEQAQIVLRQEPADVLLVDKNLPGMSGLDLLRDIKEHNTDTEVIVITGYASLESSLEALRLGAYDYLLKPFDDVSIVEEKVRLAAEKKRLQVERRQLMDQIIRSNNELRTAHERLRQTYLETLASMNTALEAQDAYTRGHSERVSRYAVAIAAELGLSKKDLGHIRDGSRLHDLGKIGIREAILNKPGSLTPEEYEHIKLHPVIGADIIGKIETYNHLLPMIRHHHERWDGAGYPDGIQGEAIPLFSRIISVADCFDAMTSNRPYRDPLAIEKALQIIQSVSGSQLDPSAVGAFLMARQRGTVVHPSEVSRSEIQESGSWTR